MVASQQEEEQTSSTVDIMCLGIHMFLRAIVGCAVDARNH